MSATGTRDERPLKTYRKVRNLRYLILGWLLIAGLLNYMDRSSISIAAPFMMEDLGLSNTDIGLMGAVFSWTYAFCQLPAGYLIDKIGPRRMYFISMGMWSFATALMAFGHNMAQDRKSTRLNSSHVAISYAVFCLKKKKKIVDTNKT